jgi:hypothetical protein
MEASVADLHPERLHTILEDGEFVLYRQRDPTDTPSPSRSLLVVIPRSAPVIKTSRNQRGMRQAADAWAGNRTRDPRSPRTIATDSVETSDGAAGARMLRVPCARSSGQEQLCHQDLHDHGRWIDGSVRNARHLRAGESVCIRQTRRLRLHA